jgi:hypothetical protein
MWLGYVVSLFFGLSFQRVQFGGVLAQCWSFSPVGAESYAPGKYVRSQYVFNKSLVQHITP